MQGEKQKIISQWLFPTVILLVVMAGMLFNFTDKSAEMAVDSVERDITVVASRYASDLKADLTAMARSAVPVSRAIALMDECDPVLISDLCSHSPAYMVIYCDAAGKGITQEDKAVDLSGQEYFTLLLESAENTYIHAKNDGITEASAIVHATVIPDDSGYMLLTYYPLNPLGLDANNAFLDGDYFYLLADGAGNVLGHNQYNSKYLDEDNISEALSAGGYGEEVRRMGVRLRNKSTGSMKVVLGGEGRSIVYAPLILSESQNQWAVMVGVKKSYVDGAETKEWEYTRSTMFQLAIIIGVFLVILVLINLLSKMKNTENTKKLEEKADTDLLTGLNNKLATERKIKEYLEAHPNEQSMMFVLDIDNFKKINDTMGHAFGDEVLRSLGSQITGMFRVSDIVGRVGGDEFIILLKGLKDDSLLRKEGEKVARFFHDFQVGEYVKYSATASIGVAVFPKDGKDFEAIYKAADQALYSAKKRGKNQLAFYHDYLAPIVIEK